MSNHARPGAESRHNLLYWRGHDYAGVGPGAHSRITQDGVKHAIAVRKSPKPGSRGRDLRPRHRADERLSPQNSADEYLLMGLRLAEGIDVKRLKAIDGRKLDDARLQQLEAQGLVKRTPGRLRATDTGRLVLDRLIVELAA